MRRLIGEHMRRSLRDGGDRHAVDRGRLQRDRGAPARARRDRAAGRRRGDDRDARRVPGPQRLARRRGLHPPHRRQPRHRRLARRRGPDRAGDPRRADARAWPSSAERIRDLARRARAGELLRRRGPRRHLHDHQPRPVRDDHGDAGDHPAAGRDPRRGGDRPPPGRRHRAPTAPSRSRSARSASSASPGTTAPSTAPTPGSSWRRCGGGSRRPSETPALSGTRRSRGRPCGRCARRRPSAAAAAAPRTRGGGTRRRGRRRSAAGRRGR